MSSMEAARTEKLAQIEAYKQEQLQKLAAKYATLDQVGYAFNKIAITFLISIFVLVFLNDLLRFCNFIGFNCKRKSKNKEKAKINLDDNDYDLNSKMNINYDGRFESIELSLFRSLFYKKHNKIGNAYI